MEAEPDFSDLQRNLTAWFDAAGFESFSGFGNRHGSWESTFAKRGNDMMRFVSLDLTQSSAPTIGQPAPYELEVWVGAESADRFSRRMVGQLSVTEEQLKGWALQQSILALLGLAANTVDALRYEDLEGVYSRGLVRR